MFTCLKSLDEVSQAFFLGMFQAPNLGTIELVGALPLKLRFSSPQLFEGVTAIHISFTYTLHSMRSLFCCELRLLVQKVADSARRLSCYYESCLLVL